MKASQNCINFIKTWESFLSKPTFDKIGKIWNIGYGTTYYPNGIAVTANDSNITEKKATEYLQHYIEDCAKSIIAKLTTKLSQSQFDACVSLAYNIGHSRFTNSILIKVINQNPNNFDLIYKEWIEFSLSKGKFIQGLQNRRIEELKMYKNQSNMSLK